LSLKIPSYRFWKKQTKDLKTDAIQLISSSLAEILVYWNGKTFVSRWNEFAGEP
jgi:hypothetical protein